MPAQLRPLPAAAAGPGLPDHLQLRGYISKTYARWIVEGGVEEEWDDYVAELRKLNIDRLVEIWQQGYNQFYGL